MKSSLYALNIVVAALAFASNGAAVEMDGWNWADVVEDYSSAIQNYGHAIMDDSTTWWLTGPPDADDAHDYVGGWCSNAPNEYIVMRWIAPLADRPGDDLAIRMYSGPGASANVLASVDNVTYVLIGTLGGGISGVFRAESFDFDGLLGDGIGYVKVQRTANGPQTGMYFDAFGGALLTDLVPGDANDDGEVNNLDAAMLASNWLRTSRATWEQGDFNNDDMVDDLDLAILAANWGHGAAAPAVPEPASAGLLLAGAAWVALGVHRRSRRGGHD
ncbi:MAG: PEP-CTERM sorting domain-containing protein [Pirellulales bacterium]|nr:PEP-CTERM sorting domain-containing protein [Pirellulales bacterium]